MLAKFPIKKREFWGDISILTSDTIYDTLIGIYDTLFQLTLVSDILRHHRQRAILTRKLKYFEFDSKFFQRKSIAKKLSNNKAQRNIFLSINSFL